ncbi:serine protease [Massilia sp. CMS3.1]|uniref:S1 family peptidase n=1 Tax=Massilia sp. CMS3.1 TaxID=3373083 RepID=UPI003EE6AAEB
MIKLSGRRRALAACAVLGALAWSMPVRADGLARTIPTIKPSVVGVGSFLKTRSPSVVFTGTGFAVGDGLSIITNAHVVPMTLDTAKMEELGVVVGSGQDFRFRPARLVALDRAHDLAHLRLTDGPPLPALALGDSRMVAEGQVLALTGFPLGMVLGLNHVTHRATLSAITPIVMPSISSRRLDARAITQLQRDPLKIFQLDGTAYPGNSGSPVYDVETGAVLGVINMVLVKGLKETAITSPSGISYAIPARYVQELLQQK